LKQGCAKSVSNWDMEHTYNRLLTDDELRQHLEAKDTIIFAGWPFRWQELERQVERLGFGELFLVSALRGKRGDSCKIGPRD
jgi:hypothetical protein